MRDQVDFINTNDIPWDNPRPGGYRKLLSRDPVTSARTQMTRAVPSEGFPTQPQPHCHETSEEIIVVGGSLSFDGRTWLHAGGYIYHPPRWIHGFKSSIGPEATFISRTGADLDFTYFDETEDDYIYHRDGSTEGRQGVVIPSPWATKWPRLESAKGRIREFTYNRAPDSCERTVLRRYDSGSQDVAPNSSTLETLEEFYILEGTLTELTSGKILTEGYYACLRPGSPRPVFAATQEALVYHNITNER